MSAAFRSAATPTPAPDRNQPPFVVLDNLQKDYPGVRALRGVSMDLRRGEVHALVGENGAGKSTLIRILSGDVRPDGGTLSVGGETVVFAGPMDARKHGIVTIFQELMIVPELSVAENIFLGNEPGSFGLSYSRRRAERMAADILETLVEGIGVRVSQRAGSLSTAQKQLIEIARALVLRAPVIVMDEPTAALSENEAVALRRLIVRLRSEGTSILYVSHRLDEVMEIADRVTVLRGGERIATYDIGAINNTSELIGLMIGRPIAQLFPPRNQDLGEVVFSASSLTRSLPTRPVGPETATRRQQFAQSGLQLSKTQILRRRIFRGTPSRCSRPRTSRARDHGLCGLQEGRRCRPRWRRADYRW